MAEIPDSDSPGRYASSPLPNFPAAALAPYEGLPSDASSMLEDTEEEEEDDGEDTSIDEDDLDDEEVADYNYNLDDEGTEEEVDGEGEDEDEDGDGDEQDDYYDRDFDLDDFDMRDVDVDFDFEGFGFPADEERLFVDDYLDFPHEDQFGALHHALLHQLEHHLAQEHWGLRPPHSPNMDQPHVGAAARPRTQRDQLVQVEVAGQGNGGGADAPGGQRRHQRQLPPDVIDLTGDDDPEMPPRPNQAARAVPQRQSENQRRLRSQPQNAPPRLNRSDGNYVDDQQVIVLVSSDDEDQPMRASPRRNANHHHHHHHYHNHNHNHNHHHLNRHNDNSAAGRAARNARFGDQPRQPGPASAPAPAPAPAQAQHLNNHNSNNSHSNLLSSRLRPFTQLVQNLPLFQFLSNPPAIMANRNHNPDDDIVITGERNVANLPNIGPFAGPAQQFIGLGPIHLDYAAHPFPAMQPHAPPAAGAGAGAGPPKPAHEPPKPARPGFTRDTGEDVVAICPSCDQELAYDPEGDDDAPATPAKKPRSKKAMAEHHFWAVKACGHVYCKRCFENRRPPSRSNIQVGFRPDDPPSKKLFCAVEDCDSEVGAKTAWVGIFM